MSFNRRNFLRNAALGTAAMAAFPEILTAAMPAPPKKKKGLLSSLDKGAVVLFQGDSITDAGREKTNQKANSSYSFGSGYALLTASTLLNQHPSKELIIYNRGISGNKVFQLADRWQQDCLELKPSLLSILIGVNDFWHKLDGKYDGTVEVYENDYRKLLQDTLKALPEVKLVICEPFAVVGGSAVNDQWPAAFDGYRAAARKIADEFNATFIPFQTIFDEAQKHAPGKYWAADGVHPSMAGAALMAEAWLKAVS